MSDTEPLLQFEHSAIGDAGAPILGDVSWELRPGEAWVITGGNGSGKSALASAIAGKLQARHCVRGKAFGASGPAAQSLVALVSFEETISLVEQELRNDDSDFIEGGVDEGTSVRRFLCGVDNREGDGKALEDTLRAIERHPAVQACGLAAILDRGLKRLSTGEIRRALLARSLVAGPALIILDEPWAGLDTASRTILDGLLERLARRATPPQGSDTARPPLPHAEAGAEGLTPPIPILVVDRWDGIPPAFNRVLELRNRAVSFSGSREAYERELERRRGQPEERAEQAATEALCATLPGMEATADALMASRREREALVEMRDVTVQWGDNRVLDRLSWTIRAGEHHLVRGPNGSGKTTLLELISGDNPQVFNNDVRIFGRRRGTGETIWELKQRMGIVSWRLHLDYRSLDDASLEEVLVSGLHDTIGMYERMGDTERLLAREWLALALLGGRAQERFGRLSYGEQRALLVARAAIKGPELLILDEPCHGLDGAHRERVLVLLEAIAERGHSTLLHVTHDPTEVLPCERHILELCPGETPMYRIILQ